MRVVLRSDVAGVGRRGDIVDVSGGFARNFLFPEGRAIKASDGVESQAAAMRRGRDLREAKDRESAETQARLLTGTVITIEARAGSAGRLFGSVTTSDIAEAVLAQKGIQVDRRHLQLEEPIKVVGNHEVPVHLFAGVSPVLTVEVVAAG
jgi:large subunit ribosomal protein L9